MVRRLPHTGLQGLPGDPLRAIHQFAVELCAELPAREEGRMDLLAFAGFIDERYPHWPQLTPEQLRRVLEMDDYARFVDKREDLWGRAEEVEVGRLLGAEALLINLSRDTDLPFLEVAAGNDSNCGSSPSRCARQTSPDAVVATP